MPTPRKHANHAQRQRAYVRRREEARLAALAAKNTPGGAAIPTMPSTARWRALAELARTILQTMALEMEEYRDDRSEEWRDGEKGEAFEELIGQVAEALESAGNIEI